MAAVPSRSLLALACCLSLGLGCSDPASSVPPPADAAVADTAMSLDTNDPYATPSMCSSNMHWLLGNHGSILTHPGGMCIQCHTSMARGPVFSFAGTLYPSAHEPDDCYGADGLNGSEMHILVTDATGATQDVLTDQSGNFWSQTAVTFPITAVVSHDGRTRAMTTHAPTGDRNACHTESGQTAAPGRIMLP